MQGKGPFSPSGERAPYFAPFYLSFRSVTCLTTAHIVFTIAQPRPVASATAGRPILPTSSHESTTRIAMWLVAPRNGTYPFPMPLKYPANVLPVKQSV